MPDASALQQPPQRVRFTRPRQRAAARQGLDKTLVGRAAMYVWPRLEKAAVLQAPLYTPTTPHSTRICRYLQRYIQTGEAAFLNSARNVVGLTKQHAMFPVAMTVVKISGTRDDAIFMGIARPPTPPEAASVVRLWVLPGTGMVLAADDTFSDHFGIASAELVGRSVSTLGPDIQAIERCEAQFLKQTWCYASCARMRRTDIRECLCQGRPPLSGHAVELSLAPPRGCLIAGWLLKQQARRQARLSTA